MPTEDAYSSGHLALSHFGNCKCSNIDTNLELDLFSDFWVSNIHMYIGTTTWLDHVCFKGLLRQVLQANRRHSLSSSTWSHFEIFEFRESTFTLNNGLIPLWYLFWQVIWLSLAVRITSHICVSIILCIIYTFNTLLIVVVRQIVYRELICVFCLVFCVHYQSKSKANPRARLLKLFLNP